MEPYRISAPAERLPQHGALPRGSDPAEISRSWQRCRTAGLIPEQSRLDAPHHGQADRRLNAERNAALITQARPVMEYFYSQIKDSGCIILLSDEHGHLLDAAGDTDFCSRAAKVALTPGACWAEDRRGTNAIGTALIEGKPIVVNGTEHYLRSNNFLACAAAPLTATSGRLLGVIDISCDARIYHPHTFGLVRAAAQMIENRMFEIAFTHHTKLRFHMSSDCLGSMMEGAIAIGEDGKIIGANRAGFAMLGLRPTDIGTRDAAHCFDLTFQGLMDLHFHTQGQAVAIKLRQGATIHILIETFHAPLRQSSAITQAPGTAGDALNALDTGDAHISKSISQLRRVLGRNVPILLQGETGTGKDFFAQALHAAGPRAQGPFVAINCAALPEAALESELFGHAAGSSGNPGLLGTTGRMREAQGGTLYLDAIDTMPPALQTRLLNMLEDAHPSGSQAGLTGFQLISAMHEDVSQRIAANGFKAELYYHLNGLTVTLPPLRERSDLAALIARILDRENHRPGCTPHLSPELAEACAQYAWPGNLRQLSGWLRTACLMLDEGEDIIDFAHLSEELRRELTAKPARPAPAADSSLRAQSDAMIAEAVTQMNGNIAAAARHLGISRNTLYRRLTVLHSA